MNYLSIVVIVLNVGLVGLGLAYARNVLSRRGCSGGSQRSLTDDANRSASLFQVVRETLAKHANQLSDLESQPGIASADGKGMTEAFDDLWRNNRASTLR